MRQITTTKVEHLNSCYRPFHRDNVSTVKKVPLADNNPAFRTHSWTIFHFFNPSVPFIVMHSHNKAKCTFKTIFPSQT